MSTEPGAGAGKISVPLHSTLLPYSGWIALLAGVAVGLVLRLIFSSGAGRPYETMMAAFIWFAPVLVGATTVYVAERFQRRSWSYYFWRASLANVLFVLGTLLILIEGMICAIVILPLFGLIGGVAGVAMGAICRFTNWPRRTLYGVALLPLMLGAFEQRIPLPQQIDIAERRLLVDASPEQIWRFLETARDIKPEEVGSAWLYRIGVPVPESGITEITSAGPVRHVHMGKSIHFDQIADIWELNRRVRWRYLFTEDSVPPGALDDHVRIGGTYFDLVDTEYELIPRESRTELVVRMRYRVSTHFNWYARPLAAALVGNFAETILEFYGRRAVDN